MLSGGECTLNTLAGKNDIKITKGKLGTYDYQGDSGTFLYPLVAYSRLPYPIPTIFQHTHIPHPVPQHVQIYTHLTSSNNK